MTATALWWITLGVAVVVVAVVAVLLAAIVTTARRIESALERVWVVGPEIASTTAHVDVVRRINLVAADVIGEAERIGDAAGRILDHAEDCPQCPRCVERRRGGEGGVGVLA